MKKGHQNEKGSSSQTGWRPNSRATDGNLPPSSETVRISFSIAASNWCGSLFGSGDCPGSSVLSSAGHYEHLAKWMIHVVLLMPDHLHLVVTPHLGHDITELVKSWKRYLARTYRLPFQRNFFEHRIRNHQTFYAHCEYIRLNPVRAGFVNRPEDWPWVYPILEGGGND